VQPNNNRTPGQAGHPDAIEADQRAFETGDSFSDEPSDQAGTGALPSWLQNFAGAAGESDDAAKPAPSPSPELSTWDDPSHSSPAQAQPTAASQPHSMAEPAGQFGQFSGGDSGFLSEDDLPEWLRALSTDSEPAAGAAPAAAVAVAGAAPSAAPNGTAIQVPPVSRAWVTASDVPEVSAGANLLSSLVHAIDSRPDADEVQAAVAASAPPQSTKAAARPQAAAPAASALAPAASAPAESASATTDTGRWSRTRVLLVAALIVVLLLFIFFLTGN
jgi:hypothetical protein